MSVTVERKPLLAALQLLAKLISKRQSIPIEACVEVSAGASILSLIGHVHGQVALRRQLRLTSSGPFSSVAIPIHILKQVVSRFPSETVTLATPANDETPSDLNLSSEGISLSLRGYSVKDFPPLAKGRAGAVLFSVDVGALKDGLRKVIDSAATDDYRPVLTGISFRPSPGGVELATCDGFRLSVAEVECQHYFADSQIIIPAKPFYAFIQSLRDDDYVAVRGPHGETLHRVVASNSELRVRCIEGNYPDYRNLIPPPAPSQVTVNPEEAVAKLKLLEVVAAEGSGIVRFTHDGRALSLEAKAEEFGTASSQLAAPLAGLRPRVALNWRYALDTFRKFQDKVTMHITIPSAPVMFKGADSFTQVVMPMFVQWDSRRGTFTDDDELRTAAPREGRTLHVVDDRYRGDGRKTYCGVAIDSTWCSMDLDQGDVCSDCQVAKSREKAA